MVTLRGAGRDTYSCMHAGAQGIPYGGMYSRLVAVDGSSAVDVWVGNVVISDGCHHSAVTSKMLDELLT
eukprot:326031-Amphidinium_carterae.1